MEEALEETGSVVSVVAAPGMGASTVAGAVASRWRQRHAVVAARLAGAIDIPHLFHLVGWSLSVPFPGDQAAVGEALDMLGPALVVLDEGDHPRLSFVLDRLTAVAPRTRFLVAGRSVVTDGRSFRLPPLPAEVLSSMAPPGTDLQELRGSPSRARLAQEGLSPAELDGWLETADPEILALALCPGGLPGPPPPHLPDILRLPSDPHTCILRRSLCDALRRVRRPAPSEVLDPLRHRLGPLLPLAEGRELSRTADARHLDPLALLARGTDRATEAARATAALARIRTSVGQAGPARSWIRSIRRRHPDIPPRERALLHWAEAEAWGAEGEDDAANRAWSVAGRDLSESENHGLSARLFLARGIWLHGRGRVEEAEAAFERSQREASEAGGEGSSFGDYATIGLASLQRLRGNWEAAEHLLASVAAAGAAPPHRSPGIEAARLLEAAALAMERGELERADEHLQAVDPSIREPLVLQASLEYRRAELALRRGDLASATASAARAAAGYGRAGERIALARALRLQADAEAGRGALERADDLYQRAVRAQVRAGDLSGLNRTLAHRAVLERDAGDPELARELESLRDDLHRLMDEEG